MEKKEQIEKMYFIQKMSLTEIAEKLGVSVSYISRLLKNNEKYHDEKMQRKQDNLTKRRNQQKELIYNKRKEKRIQEMLEYHTLKNQHRQATKELSRRNTIGNAVIRKWCSLYSYNKQKKCYEFNTKEALKPIDFPLYIKV